MAAEIDVRLKRTTSTKWNKYPKDILPAWIADMDLGISAEISQALIDRITNGDLGYSSLELQDELINSFSDRYLDKFNTPLDPELAVVGTDVVQSLYTAVLTLTDPGDGVIVQTPIYPPFLSAVGDRTLLENPLIQTEDSWEINFEQLEQLASSTKAKLLLLCNPHNPTGRVFTQTELVKIANVCQRYEITVVSDEIHCDIVYRPNYHIPFASISPEFAPNVITMASATKSFNIAGLKCSITHFGSEDLLTRYNSIPERVRGSVSSLGMISTIAAWNHGEKWLNSTLEILETNRDTVCQVINSSGTGMHISSPEGTYLGWIDFRDTAIASAPFELLMEKAKVSLSPGPEFGKPGLGWARLNFATDPEILKAILTRITAVL